ncbi:MAG: DMT family transporter [Candidatus Micrarchaeales archaeon]|nr:DMT family transporter [Candidatus Micrarchaeales archaeon]
MSYLIGVLFAFAALFLWGGGDFLIQRTTRRIGDWETLFLIVGIGTVVLTPFVYTQIIGYLSVPSILIVLVLASVLGFFASMLFLESLKRGKIAAVEPIMALEIPVVAIMSLFIISEMLSPLEILLVAAIMVGLILVSLKEEHLKHLRLERGVLLMVAAAVLFGASAFFVGYGARLSNPLFVNWFTGLGMAILTFVYLLFKGDLHELVRNTLKFPKLVLATALVDTFAWVSFAFASVFIPITIAVALSENYIGVAALLGLLLNKEKLVVHQKAGFAVALAGAVALSFLIGF